MTILFGSSIHRGLAKISILLVMLALASGILGCNHDGESCTLTITSSIGGSVSAPGEGTFAYDVGTVVELLAIPDDGYEFQAWTGDVEEITDPNSASTNITVNGDYSIAATFDEEGGPSPVNPY
jgi:hypothetical protein